MNTDNQGIITDPGKFEGEHRDILYWYDLMMDGSSDDCISDPELETIIADYFDITDLDRTKLSHPNKSCQYAILWYSEAGFVSLEYTDTYPELHKY